MANLLEAVSRNLRGALNTFFARETGEQAKEQARGWTIQYDRVPALSDMYPVLGREHTVPLFEDTLLARYARYEEMDMYPETSLVLDLYADDSTVRDQIRHRILWSQCSDKAIEGILDDTVHTLRGEKEAWVRVRNLAKYGNTFGELIIGDDERPGIQGINYLPTPTMRRVEDRRGTLLGFYQIQAGRIANMTIRPEDFKKMLEMAKAGGVLDKPYEYSPGGVPGDIPVGTSGPLGNVILFEPPEIVHWRLKRDMRGMYGLGVLESADWVWRRLRMLEDAVLVHKLTRAPGRYAFYINAGKQPPEKAWAYVKKIKGQYKKRKFINPRTGDLDMRFNALAVDEDFWIPIIGGEEQSRIETLSGPDYQGMEEVDHFLKKLYTATKVPRQYMDFAENMNKSLLSSDDVRFARAAMRLQNAEVDGWNQIGDTQLYLLGYDLEKIPDHGYHMSVPSAIFELAMVEVLAAKADLASRMQEFVSVRWIMEHIFGWSDEEIDLIFDQWAEERIWKGIIESMAGAEGSRIQGEADLETERKRAELEQSMAGSAGTEEERRAAREAPSRAVMATLDRRDRQNMVALSESIARDIRNILEDGNSRHEKDMEGRLAKLLADHNNQFAQRIRLLNPFMAEMRHALSLSRANGRR